LPDASLVIRREGTNGVLTIDPVPGHTGQVTVVVRVDDGITNAYSQPLEIKVVGPPALAYGNTSPKSERIVESESEEPNETPAPPGDTTSYTGNALRMEFVWVSGLPGGGRWPGRPGKGGWVGRYEVTQDEYQDLIGDNPSYHHKGRAQQEGWEWDPRLPVEQVSWFQAKDFCVYLTAIERNAGRLPKVANPFAMGRFCPRF
jgi:hypothetical protein